MITHPLPEYIFHVQEESFLVKKNENYINSIISIFYGM